MHFCFRALLVVLLFMVTSLPSFALLRAFPRSALRCSPLSVVASSSRTDEQFMHLALRHAQNAFREREVPIGAVLVDENGAVIAAARNRVEDKKDATAHAEIECLRAAAQQLNNWRLANCTLYTTLEPCPTCMGAIQAFRVKRLVYGARDVRLGACGSYLSMPPHPFHDVEVTGDVLASECSVILRRFFQSVRKEKGGNGSFDLGRGQETLPSPPAGSSLDSSASS